MTSVRKRLQLEKKRFQEELSEGLQTYEASKFSHDDYESSYDEDFYNDYNDYDFYDDYDDQEDADYYDDYDDYEQYNDEDYYDYDYDYYGINDDINEYMNSIKPGNHIKNNRTGDVYLYTEDYKYVNILTGKYETPDYWYDYLEIVL